MSDKTEAFSEEPEAVEPEDVEDDGYQPLTLPPGPTDPAARRAAREQNEQMETRREIVLGQLAVAYAALDAADEASDEAAAATAQETINRLLAERDEV